MGKIKVIFLDVDGVLNSDRTARRTQSGYTFVDNRQMKNLKHIIMAGFMISLIFVSTRIQSVKPCGYGLDLSGRTATIRFSRTKTRMTTRLHKWLY